MNLAEFAVKAPVKITMLFLLVILLGWISMRRLPVNLFPDLRAPKITTEVRTRGLSPQEVERRVAQPFERALYTVRGVTDVKSISRADSAVLIAEFTWETPMDFAFLDVKKAAAEAQRFGGDDIESVNVLRYDPNARPIVTLALSSEKRTSQVELRQIAKRIVEPQLERLEGVASVNVTGGEEREILIALDEVRLLAERIEVNQVVSAIRQANINASGGWIEEGARRYLLKAAGLLQSAEDLRDVVIGRRGKIPILLREVADVRETPKEKTSVVRFDGRAAVGLSCYREASANTVGVAKLIREEARSISKVLPPGVKLTVAQDQSGFIEGAIGEVKSNAVVGGLLAIVVLFVFLGDLRSTAVIGLSIPISVIATFNLMYFSNMTLNLMSLGGLALGVGMLVDNAIVTLENIHRLHMGGVPARRAAIQGTQEVVGALAASTLTTVAVFLPIVYIHGVAGLLFKEQALTVSFSLLASLVVAILLIPLLAYWMYHTAEQIAQTPRAISEKNSALSAAPRHALESTPVPPAQPAPGGAGEVPLVIENARWYIRWYAGCLRWSLGNRFWVFAACAALFAASAWAFTMIPQEFFPKTPQRDTRIRLTLPSSASIQATDKTVQLVESFLKPINPALEHVYAQIGEKEEQTSSNIEDPDGPNTADMLLTLKDWDKPTTAMISAGLGRFTSLDLADRLDPIFGRLPGLKARYEAQQGSIMDLIGGSQAPLLVEVMGPDSAQLSSLASAIQKKIERIPGLINVRTNILEGAPEALLKLDPTAMAAYGFTSRSLAAALAERLQGTTASTLKNDSGDTDIRVKVDFGQATVSTLKEMTFLSPAGGKVPLGDLASIDVHRGPREIVRRKQERTAYVMADLERVALSAALEHVRAAVRQEDMPRGYRLAFTGEQQQKAEAFGRLGFALLLSIVLVYMVMASIFESLLQPFLILFTIPLSGIGVIAGLLAAHQSLNVMAFIGIVMLGGIVVNNAIVLLDRVNQLREGGFDDTESLVIGGAQRLRPVLMTSLTTILGLLPLGLGFGQGAELRQAMAVSVIGGMVSSTFLTLLVIPCCQSLLDGILRRARRLFSRQKSNPLPAPLSAPPSAPTLVPPLAPPPGSGAENRVSY